MKTAFPLVSDISYIPQLCLFLLKVDRIPLKNIANKIARKEKIPFVIKNIFKLLKITPDILSLMSDLNLIRDIKLNNLDLEHKLPVIKIKLSEVYDSLSRIKGQELTELGLELAKACETKNLQQMQLMMFFAFFSSKNLPRFFVDVTQDKSVLNQDIELDGLMKLYNMKRPDAKNLIEWLKWFDINISSGNSLVLDKYVIIHNLVNSVIYLLNNYFEVKNFWASSHYFYEIRSKTYENMHLNERFIEFDKLFRIIYDNNKDKITFAPARDALLEGKGFEGNGQSAIIKISAPLDYCNKEECVLSDKNLLLVI